MVCYSLPPMSSAPQESGILEDAKFFVNSFNALEDMILNLSPEQARAVLADPYTLRSIHRLLHTYDRLPLFRERAHVSEYNDEEKTVEAHGIIQENIEAVMQCGRALQRIVEGM